MKIVSLLISLLKAKHYLSQIGRNIVLTPTERKQMEPQCAACTAAAQLVNGLFTKCAAAVHTQQYGSLHGIFTRTMKGKQQEWEMVER